MACEDLLGNCVLALTVGFSSLVVAVVALLKARAAHELIQNGKPPIDPEA